MYDSNNSCHPFNHGLNLIKIALYPKTLDVSHIKV